MADVVIKVRDYEQAKDIASHFIKMEDTFDEILAKLDGISTDEDTLNGEPGEAYTDKQSELRKEIEAMKSLVVQRGVKIQSAMEILEGTDSGVGSDVATAWADAKSSINKELPDSWASRAGTN